MMLMLRGSAQAERERFLTENWTTLEKVAARCRYRQQISSRYRSEELVPTELRPTIRTIAAMLRPRDTDQTNLPVMLLCASCNALRCPMLCVAQCPALSHSAHISIAMVTYSARIGIYQGNIARGGHAVMPASQAASTPVTSIGCRLSKAHAATTSCR